VTFPAARERHVYTCDLFGHHPEREDFACVWAKTVAAVFLRDDRSEQAGAEEIVEVFGFRISAKEAYEKLAFSRSA